MIRFYYNLAPNPMKDDEARRHLFPHTIRTAA
jgi:hypothetical protein